VERSGKAKEYGRSKNAQEVVRSGNGRDQRREM